MTFYESNREVRPAGAEVAEFIAEPEPIPPEPIPPERRTSQRAGERDGADAASDDESRE